MGTKVTTNGHRREMLAYSELSESECEDFDYVDEGDYFTPRFVRAYGGTYDVNDSQRIGVMGPDGTPFTMFGVNVREDSPLASWHAVESESMWSGTLFRILSGDDESFVVVGRYFDGGE